MKVGDLVKFKMADDGIFGLVVKLIGHDGGPIGLKRYEILWVDGHKGPRWEDEVEVVDASR